MKEAVKIIANPLVYQRSCPASPILFFFTKNVSLLSLDVISSVQGQGWGLLQILKLCLILPGE